MKENLYLMREIILSLLVGFVLIVSTSLIFLKISNIFVYVVIFILFLIVLKIFPYLVLIVNKLLKVSVYKGKYNRELLKFVRSTGLNVKEVYVKDTNKGINANVFSVGNQTRIVFFKPVFTLCNLNELKAILAYEIGHVKKHDTVLRLVLGVLIVIISVVANIFIFRFVSFNIIILLISSLIFDLLFLPIEMQISQYLERRADMFSVKIMGESDSNISSLYKLIEGYKQKGFNFTDKVNPVIKFLGTHPYVFDRIKQLQSYSSLGIT